MPAIPVPFVVALLLAVLCARLIRHWRTELRPAVFFVGASAALATMVGLRWSVDVQAIRFVQPILASLLPPSAWFCFAPLVGKSAAASRYWPHVIPVIIAAILSAGWAAWHPPIDFFLSLLFFGYGLALLRLGSIGSDGFDRVRLADAQSVRTAASLSGLVLIAMGLVDLFIAGDVNFFRGVHTASLVAMANMLALPLIAYAVAVVGRSIPDESTLDIEPVHPETGAVPPHNETSAGDSLIVEAIDRLMREKRLFRDPDLTLSRLARRAGIPARQISASANRALGKNVSQVVNEYRINEAKRLLQSSDLPVTVILFEAGFQTKSNFNREFLRITGVTPSEYRRTCAEQSGEACPISAGSPPPRMS